MNSKEENKNKKSLSTVFVSGKFEYFDSGIFELKDQQLKKAKGITLTGEEITPESVLFNAIRPTQRMMSQSQQYYKDGILIILMMMIPCRMHILKM